MVWNLIEENREYLTTYSKDGDQDWIIQEIEHKAIPD